MYVSEKQLMMLLDIAKGSLGITDGGTGIFTWTLEQRKQLVNDVYNQQDKILSTKDESFESKFLKKYTICSRDTSEKTLYSIRHGETFLFWSCSEHWVKETDRTPIMEWDSRNALLVYAEDTFSRQL